MDQEISMTIFNTTNVRTLDSIGKLYKIDVPLSENSGSGEALVYSTSSLANNKPAPASAIYLRSTEAEDSYFSITRTESQKLNLVASGGNLNLYVYTPPDTQLTGNTGHVDKYTFDAAGVLQEQSSLTNSIEIAREEQSLTVSRDLDANSVVGGTLSTTGILDKIGSLYKVNVAGEDVFIVGTTATIKSKVINVAENALKTEQFDEDGKPKAWQPEGTFNSYNAFKNVDNSWDIFAYTDSQKSVTQFSFDANKVLKSEFKDGKVLSVADVAREEISRNRNLNSDNALGLNISPAAIDAFGGLFKGSIQGEDYYLVGNSLKSSNKVAGAVPLSAALLNESGDAGWKELVGTSISSIVQSKDLSSAGTPSSVQVYATKSTSDFNTQVLKFNFSLDSDTGNYILNSDPEGIVLNAFELASAEKNAERNLDKIFKYSGKDEFGVSVIKSLDNAGGLSLVSSMGQEFLVTGKNLVSNSKKIADLTNALTMDGEAWMPEGFSASDSSGKISVVLNTDLNADVYVKVAGSISKYTFTRAASSIPWSTDGVKIDVSDEEMAGFEKSSRRDLNGDGFFGARIVEQKNAAGGLYAASYGSLGATSSNDSDSTKIYIRSEYKLALGGTVAKNAVDLSDALISSEGFWAPPAGYKITGAFRDLDNYSVIVKNDSNSSDIKKYTFEITNQTKLIESNEVGFTYDLSAKELSTLEFNLKRDLNADGIAGVKIKGNPTDKVGGLYKVQGADGDYYVNKTGTSSINNLDNAFLDEASNRWAPSTDNNAELKKLTLVTNTASKEFWIYQAETNGLNKSYSKYTFNENHVLIDKRQLTLAELVNEESSSIIGNDISGRDINGDGVVGVKVISAINVNTGIYKVSIDDKFMLIAPGTTPPPGRTADLSTALMADDINPLEIDSNGVLTDPELEGYRVFSGFKSINSEDVNTVKIFAIKSNANSQPGQSYNDVKMLTFTESTLTSNASPKFLLSSTQNLTAEELIAEEKISGKDLNADKTVGMKIDQVIDKKVGLYTSKILGQNYYFYDSPNKKSGTDARTAIDLRRAFYDENSNPWSPSSSSVNSPTIAGIVELTGLNETPTGYDIYTYTQVSGEYSVTKHSWSLDDADQLVYKSSSLVDTAELVKVEVAKKRDLSGDGVVGFRAAAPQLESDTRYEGVTKVAALGKSTESFYVVGKNLRPGTPTNPWKLSDALLSQDGTEAWSIPYEGTLNQIITAVRDVNSTDRFVYVKNFDKTNSSITPFITKYKFNKSEGTYAGEFQKLDDITLAAEELNSKRDLNFDGKLGVVKITDVKINNEAYGSSGFKTNQSGKSSGLINTTINGVDYLVVKKMPNANTLLNLDLALVDSNGAWKPSDTFKLSGIYKNSVTDETEIYGTELNEYSEPVLKKYTFSLTNLENQTPLEGYPQGITPKVLMLNSETPTSISNRIITERENVVGKDLNNDNVVGFVIDKISGSNAIDKISSLSNGTTLAKSTDDAGRIYVVGKSIATMGSTASRTANNNALRETVDGAQIYWAPDNGFIVKSILESTATSSIKVYASQDGDFNSMREYTFNRPEGTGSGADGWTLTTTSDLTTSQVVDLEVTNLKDLNLDTKFGLNYSTDQPITGLLKASLGTNDYYFAMPKPKGSAPAPLGIDVSKLLTNANGDPWQPIGIENDFSIVTAADDFPEGAAFAARGPTTPLTFFTSQFQAL